MPLVCGIKFRGTGKTYFFDPGGLEDLQASDLVIVETSRGVEMGSVALPVHQVDQSEIVGQLKPILRCATTADRLDAQHFQAREEKAVATCKEQVVRLNLPMKIVKAEYNYDGSRLTFFFAAEQRVDFRQLVRELARIFRTRIELRQIGVRDEAKMVGGIGKCGRVLCCATWLNDFTPVSIRMAKKQDLPLSPMEISGFCGRLLCCLAYEYDYYEKIKNKFPKVGKIIDTPLGEAKVTRVCVLRETVSLLLSDDSTAELTLEQLHGEEPIAVQGDGKALSSTQRRALGRALETRDDLSSGGSERTSKRSLSSLQPRPRSRSRSSSKGGGSDSGSSGSDGQRSGRRKKRGRSKEHSSR